MHELGLVEDLIREVALQAKGKGAKRVTKIIVSMGGLEELTGESFSFWFESLSKGSPLEGAELIIQTSDQEGVYLKSIEMDG